MTAGSPPAVGTKTAARSSEPHDDRRAGSGTYAPSENTPLHPPLGSTTAPAPPAPWVGQPGPVAVVAGVADDGVADGRHVHPDLVGAARLEPALDQRAAHRLGEALLHLVPRPRLSAPGRHRHARLVGLGPPDGRVD